MAYSELIKNFSHLSVTMRGIARGELIVRTGESGSVIGSIPVKPCADWQSIGAKVTFPNGKAALYLQFRGKGKLDLLDITIG